MLENKKIPSLDFIILFILVTLFLLSYPLFNLKIAIILWVVTFSLLFIYLFLDIKIVSNPKDQDFFYLCKLYVFIFLLILIIGSFAFSEIILRHQTEPYLYTHDNPIQIEEGIKYLLEGKNPYREDYFNTPLEKWSGGYIKTIEGKDITNPSLYHFISLPFYLLFSLPFYLLSKITFGWYDQRFVHLILFSLTLFLLYKFPRSKANKLLFLILFSFNPLFIKFFIVGRNDIFVFFWLILTIYLLKINKIKYSAATLALAVISKHSSWFFIPFYFLYLYFREEEILKFLDKIKNVLKNTLPFWIISLIIITPFLIWDFNSFIDDIYRYPAGTLPTSYPINGFGFSTFLWAISLIKSIKDYFPFWVFQLLIGLPFLYFLIKFQRKENSFKRMVLNYGILLFVFWFFSRFFHDNYLGFLSMIFMTAYFIEV